MSTNYGCCESKLTAVVEPVAVAAADEKELLERLNYELRDLICSQMVLDVRQPLQPYGLTFEKLRKVMGS
jgi:hypothetical protein